MHNCPPHSEDIPVPPSLPGLFLPALKSDNLSFFTIRIAR